MANFTVIIETPDISALEGKSFFSKFWEIFAVKKSPFETKIKEMLQSYARKNHRYKHQTHNLEQSTKTVGSFDYKDEIRLYIDEVQADYAEYIVKGTKNWKSDPFIDETIKALKPQITQLINNLYNETIQAFNALG